MLSPTIDPTGPVLASRATDYARFRALVAAAEAETPVTLPSLGHVQAYAEHLRTCLSDPAPRAQLAPVAPSLSPWGLEDAPASVAGGVREGRTWHLSLSPGVVALRSFDAARAEITAARARVRVESQLREVLSRSLIPGDGFVLVRDKELLPVPAWGAEVVSWSAKSRARMVRRLASLDLSTWAERTSGAGAALAMVTLTLPGDWLTVAPTGKAFKRLVENFRRRWVRATGSPWVCLWKLEFQRRGAPHMHLLMRVPAFVGNDRFEDWLSATWADVVAHPDPVERLRHESAGTTVNYSGTRYRDPRRISLYFLGHSSKHTDGKEYQHIVPAEWQARGAGPGRFWGYCGLRLAAVEVELSQREAIIVRRLLRKVHGARMAQRDRVRAARGLPPVPRRRARTLGSSGAMTGGWVLCNDALEVAYVLGRYLSGAPGPRRRGSWSAWLADGPVPIWR